MMVLYSVWISFVMALASSSLWLRSDAIRIENNSPPDADHDTCVLEFAGEPESSINYRKLSAIMSCSSSSNSKGTRIYWWWLEADKMNKIRPMEDKYIIEEYTLTIKKLAPEDERLYICIVYNKCGSISHQFKITSQGIKHRDSPVVESIEHQRAVVGENVTFSCKIIKTCSLPIWLIWYKYIKVNGSFAKEDIYRSDDIDTLDEPQKLVLTDVTLENAGWYTCWVNDGLSVTVRNAYLEVLNKTELSTLPDTRNTTATTGVKYDVLETSSNKKDGLHQNIVIYSTVIGSVVIVLVLVIVLLYIIRKKRSQTSAESAIPESYPLEDIPRVSNVSAEINVDQGNRRISSGIANSSDLYLPWDIANSSDFYLPSSVVNSSDSC